MSSNIYGIFLIFTKKALSMLNAMRPIINDDFCWYWCLLVLPAYSGVPALDWNTPLARQVWLDSFYRSPVIMVYTVWKYNMDSVQWAFWVTGISFIWSSQANDDVFKPCQHEQNNVCLKTTCAIYNLLILNINTETFILFLLFSSP